MAFLIYRKEQKEGKQFFIDGQESYRLAGWNLIYSLWSNTNKPLNAGWTISADQLLKEHNADYSNSSHSLVIDFHPNSQERIGLIEIERIHLFTYGNNERVYWTPMMLELKDIFYNDEYEGLTQEDKKGIIAEFESMENGKQFFEFLYLNGDDYSWNWGRNGMTNAAFIYDDARQYFSKFFLIDRTI